MPYKDPERRAECSRRYYEQNKERLREYQRIRSPQYNIANRDRIRFSRLLRKYGITADDYAVMEMEQDGACAICGYVPGTEDIRDTLVVDHDHKTDTVRGLLCHGCNTGIGKLQDSPRLLATAIRYLAKR